MGDVRRAGVFVDFIAEHFPPSRFPRVLDVAGGAGYVSLELLRRGYSPVLVDPRHTNLRKRDRKANRRLLGMLERRHELFDAEMARDADLVVAMHPDGATEQATRAMVHCPSIVVPCCNYWDGHSGPVEFAVRDLMMDLGNCWEYELDMKGKRLAMVGS